ARRFAFVEPVEKQHVQYVLPLPEYENADQRDREDFFAVLHDADLPVFAPALADLVPFASSAGGWAPCERAAPRPPSGPAGLGGDGGRSVSRISVLKSSV